MDAANRSALDSCRCRKRRCRRPAGRGRLAPLFQTFGDLAFVALVRGFVETSGRPEVVLGDMVARIIVGVAVSLAVTEGL